MGVAALASACAGLEQAAEQGETPGIEGLSRISEELGRAAAALRAELQ
jgi:hypothetical protein